MSMVIEEMKFNHSILALKGKIEAKTPSKSNVVKCLSVKFHVVSQCRNKRTIIVLTDDDVESASLSEDCFYVEVEDLMNRNLL